MRSVPELREACAVCAAALGAAFISGREAAAFFAVAGGASWPGIVAAAALFGLMMGMLCGFSARTGARTLPGIFYKSLDRRCGDAVSVVHGLLMLTTGAVALSTAAELGRLSLNISFPGAAAAAMAGLIAAMLTLNGLAPMSAFGMIFIPICVVYFAALALDPRPAGAGAYLSGAAASLNGNLPAAVFMGAMFAFLKAATAGGVATARALKLRPMVFGVCCGGIMAIVAGCANWALQAAGPDVQALNLPCVVLAARWGVTGYYVSVYVMWLGCVCMLCCALGSVTEMLAPHINRPAACLAAAASMALLSAAGLGGLVGVGYPMLGWICAVCLGALALFRDGGKSVKRRKNMPSGEQILG